MSAQSDLLKESLFQLSMTVKGLLSLKLRLYLSCNLFCLQKLFLDCWRGNMKHHQEMWRRLFL